MTTGSKRVAEMSWYKRACLEAKRASEINTPSRSHGEGGKVPAVQLPDDDKRQPASPCHRIVSRSDISNAPKTRARRG
jgi:hypothetical protein